MTDTKTRKPKTMSEHRELVDLPALVEALGCIGRDKGEPVMASETVELVDAVIDYYDALEASVDAYVDGLDELVDARKRYRGPGIAGEHKSEIRK